MLSALSLLFLAGATGACVTGNLGSATDWRGVDGDRDFADGGDNLSADGGAGDANDGGDTNPPEPALTFTVSGNQLLDSCGRAVVPRGVNKMSVWTDRSGSAFAEIAQTDANSVRIVWQLNDELAVLDDLIQKALANNILPMIELHDATGDFSLLGDLVDYWVRADVVALIATYQRTLLLNIGNEVGDWDVSAAQFGSGYRSAITRLREAGILVPLVIDSRGWAHDVDFVIAEGPALINHDPLHNIIFSTHLYYENTAPGFYEELLGAAVTAGLPLLIGEFGNVAWNCTDPVDYRSIITVAQQHGIGWYAWSWGPGNSPCAELDMTDDNTFTGLHGWGLEVAMTHAASIHATAQPITSLHDSTCGP